MRTNAKEKQQHSRFGANKICILRFIKCISSQWPSISPRTCIKQSWRVYFKPLYIMSSLIQSLFLFLLLSIPTVFSSRHKTSLLISVKVLVFSIKSQPLPFYSSPSPPMLSYFRTVLSSSSIPTSQITFSSTTRPLAHAYRPVWYQSDPRRFSANPSILTRSRTACCLIPFSSALYSRSSN